jgi:hypothetical protein
MEAFDSKQALFASGFSIDKEPRMLCEAGSPTVLFDDDLYT